MALTHAADPPRQPGIASAIRLCWQRSAGLAAVWLPFVLGGALGWQALEWQGAVGWAASILLLVLPLLLYTAVPIATCFTLGVANYAGVDSGIAGWQRGLRTAPIALLLLLVVWSGAALVMLIPLAGWAADLLAIPVMLLAYPMFAFEDVGVFSVWRRLGHLLGRTKEQRGIVLTLIGLLAVLVGILFVFGTLLIIGFLLVWSMADVSPFGAPAEEPAGVAAWKLDALLAGLVLCLVFLIVWTTIMLAWATQVYERIRGLDVGGQSEVQPRYRRPAVGV